MAGISNAHEDIPIQPNEVTAPRHHDLEILGEPLAACESAVHPEGQTERPRPSGRVTTGNVLQLLEFQRHCCALTGRPLEPSTASLDHIVPVRCGGAHAIENTQVLHKDVNRAKSTMTNDEFIQLCCEVVGYSTSRGGDPLSKRPDNPGEKL